MSGLKASLGDLVRIKGPGPGRKGQVAQVVAITERRGDRRRYSRGSYNLYRTVSVVILRYEVQSMTDGKIVALGASHFDVMRGGAS